MSTDRNGEREARADNVHNAARLAAELQECDPEVLAELIGSAALSDPLHPAWDNQSFLDWLTAEIRVREPRDRRLTDDDFISRGAEFMARVQAKRHGIVRRSDRLVALGNGPAFSERMDPFAPVPVVDLGIAAGVGRELWDEPAEQWVALPDEVPGGRYLALRIVGESMSPLMHTGDTVLVRLGGDLKRDTVIVARHPEDGYVCKRVHRVKHETIELASLEKGRPIITIPRQMELIVGTVVLVWCTHRG